MSKNTSRWNPRFWQRLLLCLMALTVLAGLGLPARAEELSEGEEILARAEALEADSGKLRSVSVHVYSGENPVLPNEKDTRDSAFLKYLSIALESRWTLAEKETPEMSPEDLRTLYSDYVDAELETLGEYREGRMEDVLLDFLSKEYLASLDAQKAATRDNLEDGVAFLWDYTAHRQEAVKVLFFINRYYGVPVHKVFKDQMNSFLYEGALLVQEDTIERLLHARETAMTASPAAEEGAENAPPEEEAAEASSQAGGKAYSPYGTGAWHTAPGGNYEFRLHDFDQEALTMQVDLRQKENQKEIPCGDINLSVWGKYQKNRQTLSTFYRVGDIYEEGGKLSFNLHMNVLLDGRLYQEVKGKISLKLPRQKTEDDGREETMNATAADDLEEEEDVNIPEAPIGQDFSEVAVGDVIRMGYYEQDGNSENLREPIEWRVLSINRKKHVALIVTVQGIEVLPFSTPGKEAVYTEVGFNWKNSYLRDWMATDFYEQCFTRKEKARIRLATNITKDATGRFTTKDYVFLLSESEARRYMKSVQGMICEPTPYAKAKLSPAAASAKDGYCWWVRELARAAKNYGNGKFNPETSNEGGYVQGALGMRFYSRRIGLNVTNDNTVMVRPAMWVRLGADEE